MRTYSKRTIAAVAAVTVAGSGLAFAYWTAGGTGTGTAATGTNAAITVVQTSTVNAMVPGAAVQTLSGNFDNGNTSPVYVSTVTASIAGVTLADGVTGVCNATDYTLADAAMTVGTEVPAGNAQGTWSGAKISFNNKATNQDACKGATVNLAYTIS